MLGYQRKSHWLRGMKAVCSLFLTLNWNVCFHKPSMNFWLLASPFLSGERSFLSLVKSLYIYVKVFVGQNWELKLIHEIYLWGNGEIVLFSKCFSQMLPTNHSVLVSSVGERKKKAFEYAFVMLRMVNCFSNLLEWNWYCSYHVIQLLQDVSEHQYVLV